MLSLLHLYLLHPLSLSLALPQSLHFSCCLKQVSSSSLLNYSFISSPSPSFYSFSRFSLFLPLQVSLLFYINLLSSYPSPKHYSLLFSALYSTPFYFTPSSLLYYFLNFPLFSSTPSYSPLTLRKTLFSSLFRTLLHSILLCALSSSLCYFLNFPLFFSTTNYSYLSLTKTLSFLFSSPPFTLLFPLHSTLLSLPLLYFLYFFHILFSTLPLLNNTFLSLLFFSICFFIFLSFPPLHCLYSLLPSLF